MAGLMMAVGWERLSSVQHGIRGLPFLPFLTLAPTLCHVSHYADSREEPLPGVKPINGNLVLLCVALLVCCCPVTAPCRDEGWSALPAYIASWVVSVSCGLTQKGFL